MRLTHFSDFGLRVLVFLACHPDRRVPTAEIAEAYGISLDHLQKVVRSLGELGFVALQRGRGGGVALALAPEEISVGAVLRQLEGDIALLECFDPAQDECVISPSCGLKGPLHRAQEAFFAELDGVTLAAVLADRSAKLKALLGSR